MFSGTTKYLIDANAIRSMSVEMITSKLGTDRIIATIPDVKHEVLSLTRKLDLIHIDTFADDVYIKAKEIINCESVKNVIDYYNYKGAADVMLLAHALTVGGVGIFKDEVIIVTNDVNLRLACDDLGVLWKSMEYFRDI